MSVALAVGIAGAVLGVLALLAALVLHRRLSTLRRAQQAIVRGAPHDVLEFAILLQTQIDDLRAALGEVGGGLTRLDRRIDSAVTNTAVVRYDAWEDAGGQQSASFAFLDTHCTGTVVTAIQGRDYARVYVKELNRGASSVALSAEEQKAVERAMAR
ncbi:MAG: DUF4446 family protein [Thermoleophilia bacterium]|nr:DUF4446 family protein [Thermoleophilia bacterium]